MIFLNVYAPVCGTESVALQQYDTEESHTASQVALNVWKEMHGNTRQYGAG